MPPVITRRHLLHGALLPFAGVFSIAGGLGPASLSVLRWVRNGRFPDVRAAAHVGQLYLQKEPGEGSAAWLANELFGCDKSCDVEREGVLRARLCAGRQQDFCKGDLVVLKGWVFTRTEARLLALLSLSTGAGNAARL